MIKNTYSDMKVSELQELLKDRGFKLGGSCSERILSSRWYDSVRCCNKDIWFKDSALCSLTYIDKNTELSYFAGNMTLLADCEPILIKDIHSSSSYSEYINSKRLLSASKDIRDNLFAFYDKVESFVIPEIYMRKVNFLSFDTYIISNLISREQLELSDIYAKANSGIDDMDFYSFFNVLSFMHNYQFYSKDLQKVLRHMYKYCNDVLAANLCMNRGTLTRNDYNKAYLWCLRMLDNHDITWKPIS